ncbi:DUF2634 domain-containing protein [Aneurinibacillus thermoaerophilus]|uniref:DUF2634 domain-containing protein n=1 Tax=Aneurinibacillus TaxID=55079 RepID=UPI00070FF376|nr:MULTISPECIES: DUF2634 domain-containing protein [Aneurinibacillus]AMA72783.1 hypothetical protein ACH33_07890 [Aneurinibacillus sp. XH2]MED0756922.1 DUF2634 domain-containing protein [Aneurinibacillus thermoaerophilus]MED0760972.1 DUF2634 domain-containing protein [Aneurinibacillus thermoaerophilus]
MSVFPEFPEPAQETPQEEEIRSLRTYAFDINTGKFILQSNGKPVIIDGAEALEQNGQKALSTERYVFPIYTSDYGHELKQLIRSDGTREWKQAEAERLVKEAIEYLYGVDRCENFEFEWVGASLKINYVMITDEGVIPQEVYVE